MTAQPRILSPADCLRVLDEVRGRSDDYQRLWRASGTARPFADLMARVRRRVDPDRPYFIDVLANGIAFAGDARDVPSVLHSLYPRCNATLIRGLIREIGDRDGDVLDIGANIGVVAASLARHLGPRGRLHAFEPDPGTVKLAAATLALNGSANATLTEAAIGDRDGDMTFQSTPGNSAIASAREHDFAFLNDWAEITVASRRLDTLVAERGWEAVSLIKVDVEGHELKVIEGGLRAIRRFRPTVVYEFTPVTAAHHGWTAGDSVSLLRRATSFDFGALIEPPPGGAEGGDRLLPFPLPDGITDQVNVFARPGRVRPGRGAGADRPR